MLGEQLFSEHPPTLLLQTVNDRWADKRASTYYFEAMEAAGAKACINHAPGNNHGMVWCQVGSFLSFVFQSMPLTAPPPFPPGYQWPFPPPFPPPSSSSNHPKPVPTSANSCFAKESSTACLFASPLAEPCSPVLMVELAVGDLVLGRHREATTVIAVQHKAIDTTSEMLTFHMADGTTVSMTPNHGLFADGKLIAAAECKVGSTLSTGVLVERISKSEATIINPVTADGTIVADGVLAASNPFWIASRTVDSPLARTIVNAALFAAGDVDSIAAGVAAVSARLVAALGLVVAILAPSKMWCWSRPSEEQRVG